MKISYGGAKNKKKTKLHTNTQRKKSIQPVSKQKEGEEKLSIRKTRPIIPLKCEEEQQ